MKRIEISEIQRGLVIKNGRIESILEPGRHWILDPFAKTRVLAYDLNKVEFVSEWTDALLRGHPGLTSRYFTVADVGDNQIGIGRCPGPGGNLEGDSPRWCLRRQPSKNKGEIPYVREHQIEREHQQRVAS